MLENDIIRLRPVSIHDSDFILSLRNDMDLAKEFFSDPPLYDFQHDRWLRNTGNMLYFIIEDHLGEKYGTIHVSGIDYKNQKCEFGIAIQGSFQRRGLAKQASKMLIDYIFGNLPLRKITLEVFADNTGALSLYRNLGFEIEGTFRDEYFKCGRWRDSVRMALFKERWQAQRQDPENDPLSH